MIAGTRYVFWGQSAEYQTVPAKNRYVVPGSQCHARMKGKEHTSTTKKRIAWISHNSLNIMKPNRLMVCAILHLKLYTV